MTNQRTGDVTPAVVAQLLRDSLRSGQQPRVTVTSNSMSPLLRAGDRVCLAPAAAEELENGDVIVLECPGSLLTHRFRGRITAPDGVRLVTRGDRILSFDAPFAPQQLVGRVTGRAGRRRGERCLDLRGGWGRRLDRFLARFSRLELVFFAWLCREPRLGRLPAGSDTVLVFSQLPQPRFTRALRRAFHTAAWAFTGWARLY